VLNSYRSRGFPLAKHKTGGSNGKDRSGFTSIEELAGLREHATDKLFEKVATRRAEREAELEKLAQYGKPPVKKAESAPAPKAKTSEEAKEPKESIAEAA
jgi:hypothetical protein